jgi:hypothetical protein
MGTRTPTAAASGPTIREIGKVLRLAQVHAAEVDCHQERRELIIGHSSRGRVLDEPADLVGGENPSGLFPGNNIDR